MISKSVIHAFLARMAGAKIVLAGFSVAFAFYYTITSATEVSTVLSLSFLRDRRSVRHLLGFFCLVVIPPVAITLLMALTPMGDVLYGGLFGVSPPAVAQARFATLVLSFSAPVLMFRALAFALIMLNRRTVWITLSTLLRFLSLGVSLIVLPHLLEGAAAGAAALVFCMLVETLFAWGAAWRFYRALPATAEGPMPGYGELWRFSWPLMLSQMMEMGITTGINLYLGRLRQADLALASFGVVQGLANVLLSPMRNLAQTAQTLVRTAEDARTLMRFAAVLALVFTLAIMAIFFSPLREWVLVDVMGLSEELAAYSTPAVKLAFLVAGGWGFAALFRGLLAAARRTNILAASAMVRLATVGALGSVVFLWPGLNGAVFGMLIWALTFAVECAVLGSRIRRGIF